MKYLYIIILATFIFASCHESIEERAYRETREFTRKNCPAPVATNIVCDSMSFTPTTRTINYYYSLYGTLDTTYIDKTQVHNELLSMVKDSPALRTYKDAGFNFSYIYQSAKNKGKLILTVTITPQEYNE